MLKWKNYIYSLHANRLKLNLALKVPIFSFNGDHHYKTTVSNCQILLVWVFLSFLVLFFFVKTSPRWFFKSLHMWSCICSWPNCYLFTTTHAGDYGDVNDGKQRCPLDTPTWCICKWATAKWIKGEGCNEVSEAYDGLSSLAYYPLNLRMSDGNL